MTGPACFTIVGSGSWLARANGAAAQTAAIQLHALTYNWTRVMQLANTPPLQSATLGTHHCTRHTEPNPVTCGAACWERGGWDTPTQLNGKEEFLYSASTHRLKVLRHRSHSFTCKLHHACLVFVSIHQMVSPLTVITDIQLQLTTHWSTLKGWKAELALLFDL